MVMLKLILVRLNILILNPWFFLPVMSLFVLLVLRLLHNDLMRPKWDIARFPKTDDLKVGKYKVVMLPRCLFFWFQNVKYLEMTSLSLEMTSLSKEFPMEPLPGNTALTTGGFTMGYNMAWGRYRWGRFSIWCRDRALSLNYGGSKFPVSMIRDMLREVEPGVFLGRFMLKVKERYLFVFWFKLIEIEKEEAE